MCLRDRLLGSRIVVGHDPFDHASGCSHTRGADIGMPFRSSAEWLPYLSGRVPFSWPFVSRSFVRHFVQSVSSLDTTHVTVRRVGVFGSFGSLSRELSIG